MGKSLREKAVMATFGVIAFYAVAVVLWFVSAESAWKKSFRNYAKAKETLQKECKLISEKRQWEDAYETEKSMMPTFEAGKATDTTWLRRLDALAVSNLVVITGSKAGNEREAGEVLELPIEVRGWEGSLQGLVQLMHQLENSNDGMFDITEIAFKPSNKKGYLRGNFVLNCAYMRR